VGGTQPPSPLSGHQTISGRDASHVTRRATRSLSIKRTSQQATHRRPGITSPTMPSPPTSRTCASRAILSFSVRVGGGRGGRADRVAEGRPARRPETRLLPKGGRRGGRMDRYYAAQRHGSVSASVLLTTTDGLIENQTFDRGPRRRQDLLLLHQRQRYREAPHLGGAGRRRYAGADHRARARDIPGCRSRPQVPRDPERRLEPAAVAGLSGRLERIGGCGSCAEILFPCRVPGFPMTRT